MADYLPPRELWPSRIYNLPEFATYPNRFNPTEELLDKAVAGGRGERVALLFEEQRITYAQLLTQANKFGNALRALGIGEGDRVLLRTPTIPPAIAANFAVLKLGAMMSPCCCTLPAQPAGPRARPISSKRRSSCPTRLASMAGGLPKATSSEARPRWLSVRAIRPSPPFPSASVRPPRSSPNSNRIRCLRPSRNIALPCSRLHPPPIARCCRCLTPKRNTT